MARKHNLTEGSVRGHLTRLTIPMIFGMISMVAFNLIDTYFVGQLGALQLAALSFTFPVIMIIFSLIQGIGIGATALISQSIGRKDHDRAARETTDSLVLGLITAIILVIIGSFSIKPVFQLLGASEEIMPYITAYMQPWFYTIVFIVIPFIGNSALRATGDAITPTIIMLCAVICNAVLDPILIFGNSLIPAMGIKGAAYATAISRAITAIVSIFFLYHREKLITTHIPSFDVLKGCWKSILYIGVPTGFSRMMTPIAVGAITALLAQHDAAAVAAFGVGTRIEFLIASVLTALSASVGPFVGQNMGANKYGRIASAIRESSWFSVGWGIIAAIFFAFATAPVAHIFTESDDVIHYLSIYLHILPFGIGFQGLVLIINASLNTLNKPIDASILIALQNFGIYIPMAFIGSNLYGVQGIFAAIALAYIVGGISSLYWHNKKLKNLTSSITVQ